MNGQFLVTNCLKKARKISKKKKSCTKSEKLLEGLKVAPNLKSCSKVAEHLMYSPNEPDVLSNPAKTARDPVEMWNSNV